jgi:hypothetical protein
MFSLTANLLGPSTTTSMIATVMFQEEPEENQERNAIVMKRRNGLFRSDERSTQGRQWDSVGLPYSSPFGAGQKRE